MEEQFLHSASLNAILSLLEGNRHYNVVESLALQFRYGLYGSAVSPYHPHHEVGEDGYPQGGGQEGDHEPAVPAGEHTVRHSAVQQQAQGPRDQPLDPRTATICHTHNNKNIPELTCSVSLECIFSENCL